MGNANQIELTVISNKISSPYFLLEVCYIWNPRLMASLFLFVYFVFVVFFVLFCFVLGPCLVVLRIISRRLYRSLKIEPGLASWKASTQPLYKLFQLPIFYFGSMITILLVHFMYKAFYHHTLHQNVHCPPPYLNPTPFNFYIIPHHNKLPTED